MLFNNIVLRRINTLLDTPVFYGFFFILSLHFVGFIKTFITTFDLFITTLIQLFLVTNLHHIV